MQDQFPDRRVEKISAEIAALASLSVKDLKLRWRGLYDTEPPLRISPELLTRAIAYRLQEREFGGLDSATRRQLERAVDDRSARPRRSAIVRKAPSGTLLIREWQGKAHHVILLDDGVNYQGRRYGSLSEVARLITGTRWSGPLFFGLRKSIREAHDGAN